MKDVDFEQDQLTVREGVVEDVSTTQIYTHVMAKPGLGVRSPLDDPRNNP